jgi:hypothetical protein
MKTKTPPIGENPPLCACGCGAPVTWRRCRGWATYRVGHYATGKPSSRRNTLLSEETRRKMSDRRLLYYAKRNRPGEQPPEGAIAPSCGCGCGLLVLWRSGFGWNTFCAGHRKQQSVTAAGKSLREHYAGKRKRDLEPVGPAVYGTYEYRQARAQLVEHQPCRHCGRPDRIHAHHVIPGDDSSLVPLCEACHVIEHQTHGNPYNGRTPLDGSSAPLCACGCGRPVKWKRVRGWATYCKGHGVVKVPAGTKDQAAPLCQCGCGEPTKFRFGKGWNPYKRGHRQRVTGGYRTKPKTPAP